MRLTPGTRVGPYEVVTLLGAGGMAEVYRAKDTRLGRDVAIKVVSETLGTDGPVLERFEREAKLAASLAHPNVVALFDVGLHDGKPYFITRDGRVRLLDFGIAKLVEAVQAAAPHGLMDQTVSPSGSNTGTGMLLGTPGYMSPEQARGQAVDARSYLWALGVVLYEMVTGSRPFDGPTPPIIFDALLNKAPQPVTERNPKVPAGLEKIIGRLLEKDRELRYPSAAELRDDLERLHTGTRPVARRRRNPLLRHELSAVAVLILAAGGLYFWRQRTQAKPLTDNDVLVLADFANTTDDPVFDSTLRQGLAVQLEQSPFLKIMDDEQVQQSLRLMSLPPGARITNQIAHDICVRDGAAATIDGAIASLGKSYVITLQAITCQGGATLATPRA